jgi:hypothetical protein
VPPWSALPLGHGATVVGIALCFIKSVINVHRSTDCSDNTLGIVGHRRWSWNDAGTEALQPDGFLSQPCGGTAGVSPPPPKTGRASFFVVLSPSVVDTVAFPTE